jgi:hypothetical protein
MTDAERIKWVIEMIEIFKNTEGVAEMQNEVAE